MPTEELAGPGVVAAEAPVPTPVPRPSRKKTQLRGPRAAPLTGPVCSARGGGSAIGWARGGSANAIAKCGRGLRRGRASGIVGDVDRFDPKACGPAPHIAPLLGHLNDDGGIGPIRGGPMPKPFIRRPRCVMSFKLCFYHPKLKSSPLVGREHVRGHCQWQRKKVRGGFAQTEREACHKQS